MEGKYILGCTGVVGLVVYGIAALHYGHNGSVVTLVVTTIGGLVAGVIGYALAKKA